jgi:hypothetical protein
MGLGAWGSGFLDISSLPCESCIVRLGPGQVCGTYIKGG